MYDGSIDTAHIAADQITSKVIADDAIDSEHYTDGSIDTAHIADNQSRLAKMAGGVAVIKVGGAQVETQLQLLQDQTDKF